MRIRVWGCRGSLASPGPDTVKYGGNTSSVEVRLADGTLVIFDAGTGIRELGASITNGEPTKKINLFLTHLHLDHVEGLGFFPSLWDPEVELHVWGPPSSMRSLEDRIATLMSPPLFPVKLGDVPCRPVFHDVPESEIVLGGATIRVEPVTHRGATVAYRIDEGGRSFVYIPDHEPALGGHLEKGDARGVSGLSLAKGADLLFHDSQYTEEEYPTHKAWGHSSIAHTVGFAQLAEVGELVLFHHDPSHTDEQLEGHRKRAKELWGGNNDAPVLAHEGMEIELS